MFIDLVGDYAGKELFLIEGDSLLRECFEDERIDFDGKLTCSCLTMIKNRHLQLLFDCFLGLCSYLLFLVMIVVALVDLRYKVHLYFDNSDTAYSS